MVPGMGGALREKGRRGGLPTTRLAAWKQGLELAALEQVGEGKVVDACGTEVVTTAHRAARTVSPKECGAAVWCGTFLNVRRSGRGKSARDAHD